jgi:hypothetical protein
MQTTNDTAHNPTNVRTPQYAIPLGNRPTFAHEVTVSNEADLPRAFAL